MSTPSVVVKNRARQIACDLTRVWATPREPQTRGEHSLREGQGGAFSRGEPIGLGLTTPPMV